MVRLATPGGERTTRVIAPEAGAGRDRGRVRDFVRSLPDTPATTTGYGPTTVAVLATGGVGTDGATPPRPWPLRSLAEGSRTSEGLCGLVTGAEVTTVTGLVAGTRAADSQWISDDRTFAVSVRPLLPHERTCADLGHG